MTEPINLEGNAQSLVNAIDQAANAWLALNKIQLQSTQITATNNGEFDQITKTFTGLDASGRKVSATFQSVEKGFEAVSVQVGNSIAALEKFRQEAARIQKIREIFPTSKDSPQEQAQAGITVKDVNTYNDARLAVERYANANKVSIEIVQSLTNNVRANGVQLSSLTNEYGRLQVLIGKVVEAEEKLRIRNHSLVETTQKLTAAEKERFDQLNARAHAARDDQALKRAELLRAEAVANDLLASSQNTRFQQERLAILVRDQKAGLDKAKALQEETLQNEILAAAEKTRLKGLQDLEALKKLNAADKRVKDLQEETLQNEILAAAEKTRLKALQDLAALRKLNASDKAVKDLQEETLQNEILAAAEKTRFKAIQDLEALRKLNAADKRVKDLQEETLQNEILAAAEKTRLKGLQDLEGLRKLNAADKRIRDLQEETLQNEILAAAEKTRFKAMQDLEGLRKLNAADKRIRDLQAERSETDALASAERARFQALQLFQQIRNDAAARNTSIRSAIEPTIQAGVNSADASKFGGSFQKAEELRSAAESFRKVAAESRLSEESIKRLLLAVRSGERDTNLYAAANGKLTEAYRVLGAEAKRLVAAEEAIKKEIADIKSGADKLSPTLAKLQHAFGTLLAFAQFGLYIKIFSGLTTAIQNSAEAAVEFQVKIAQIQTIDLLEQSTARWSSELLKLSNAFGIPILDQASAAYQTLSNQVGDGARAISFMAEANTFAVATISTAKDSVDLLSATLNAFGMDVTQTNKIAGSFFKTIELGRIVADDLANDFGRIAIPAAQLGVGLDELQAGLAITTINGIKYSEAATLIRNVLLKLIRPTDAMKDFFRELGVNSGEAAIAAFGLSGFLGKLEERAHGSSTELGELFGRVRAITGAMIFAGDGAQRFEVALAEIREASKQGLIDEKAALVLANTGKRLEDTFNRITNFFVGEVGGPMLEFFNKAIGGFENLEVIVRRFVDVLKLLAIGGIAFAVEKMFLLVAANNLATISFYNLGAAVGKTWLLLRAHPLIAIATGLAVIATLTKSAEERFAILADEIIASSEKAGLAVQKNIADELVKVEAALKERTKLINREAANSLGPLNKYLDDSAKSFKTMTDSVEKSVTRAIKNIGSIAGESEKVVEKFVKRSKESLDEVAEARRDLGEILFNEKESKTKDPVKKLELLLSRVAQLEALRNKALKSGDKKTFEDITKEINKQAVAVAKLNVEATEKNLWAGFSLTAEQKEFQFTEELLKNLEKEIKLRQQLAKEDEARAKIARDIALQQKSQETVLIKTLEVFKGTDFSKLIAEAESSTDVESILAARQETIKALAKVQTQLGVDTGGSTQELKELAAKEAERAALRIRSIELQTIVDKRKADAERLDNLLQAAKDIVATETEARSKQVLQITEFGKNLFGDSPGVISGAVARSGGGPSQDLVENRAILFDPLVKSFKDLGKLFQIPQDQLTPEDIKLFTETQFDVVKALSQVIGQKPSQEALKAELSSILASPQQESVALGEVNKFFSEAEKILNILKISQNGRPSLVDQQVTLANSETLVRDLAQAVVTAQAIDPASTGGKLPTTAEVLAKIVSDVKELLANPPGPEAATGPLAKLVAETRRTVEALKTPVPLSSLQKDQITAALVTKQVLADNANTVATEANTAILEEALGKGKAKAATTESVAEAKRKTPKELAIEQAASRAQAREAFNAKQAKAMNLTPAQFAELIKKETGSFSPNATQADAQAALNKLGGFGQAGVDPLAGLETRLPGIEAANLGSLLIDQLIGQFEGVTPESAGSISTETLDAISKGFAQSIGTFDDGRGLARSEEITTQAINNVFGNDSPIYAAAIQLEGAGLSLQQAASIWAARINFADSLDRAGIPTGFAEGGKVRGPGGRDVIPAMLTNGEFVTNASATGKFLPLLQAINSGRVQGFARGGPVGNSTSFNINVTESSNAQATAREVVNLINRGQRQGTTRLRKK